MDGKNPQRNKILWGVNVDNFYSFLLKLKHSSIG